MILGLMKSTKTSTLLIASLALCVALVGCGDKVTAVDSGTYEGSISQVKPDEQEIYVQIGEGQKLELYFTPETTLTRNGETASFEQLEAGQRVSVEVKREGNRMNPVAVEILE